MRWLRKIFHRTPLSEVLADQLFEAERLHAEHLAAAEVHAALAGAYNIRVQRIRAAQQSAQVSQLRPAT
jgi:hypothetical protein